jgi:hypothetical protein
MIELEPLDAELADLFSAERAAPTVDAPARATMRARLLAAAAQLPVSAAAAGTLLGGGGGKALAIVAIALAAGGGTVAMLRDAGHDRTAAPAAPREMPMSSSSGMSRASAPAVPREVATPAPTTTSAPRAIAMPVAAASRSRVKTAPVPTTNRNLVAAAPTAGDGAASPALDIDATTARDGAAAMDTAISADVPLAPTEGRARISPDAVVTPTESRSQLALVRRAWLALSAGEPALALQLVDEDARLHPDGVLAEERAAVHIAALAKLNRTAEARAAAARFIQLHPTSVHRARIERAIEEAP